MNSLLKKFLICLKCKSDNLEYSEKYIKCNSCKHQYTIIEGIPILIDEDKNDHSYHLMDKRNFDYDIFVKNKFGVLKFVEENVKGTSGYLYKNKLKEYPIPKIDLNKSSYKDKTILDLGCGWGRWTLSFAKDASVSIGVDVSLESLICASIIAKELNLNCLFIYADLRNLPFKKETFDLIYSYSVLQHLSPFDFYKTLKSSRFTLKKNSKMVFQIMNKYALRNIYIQYKRKFRKPKGFEVRYYKINNLKRFLAKLNFDIKFKNCSFFTQARITDFSFLTFKGKIIVLIAFIFNFISKYLIFLKYFSDNLYFNLKK